MIRTRPLVLALLLGTVPHAALATQAPDAGKLRAADHHAVVDALVRQLDAKYVFPEIARKVATSLQAKAAAGAYADATTHTALAEAITRDLQALAQDDHFKVFHEPGFRSPPAGAPQPPSAEDLAMGRQHAGRVGYGLGKVERLAGNVGYLEVRGFPPTELVGEQITAAMKLVSGSDALILDLRRNGGGEPATVTHLLSHFFRHGDQRHLNDLYYRDGDRTQQFWTNPAVEMRYDKPVYVLTSKRTFSGGEECAYDFQTQKRGTLVGEATGGGSNPGDVFALAQGFVAFIPTGRAINPVTGTNWERIGVKPDIEVAAPQAQTVAHAAILRTLLAAAKEPEQRAELQQALAELAGPGATPGG
jgi:hypothetical protein